jgi:hypothetical protein
VLPVKKVDYWQTGEPPKSYDDEWRNVMVSNFEDYGNFSLYSPTVHRSGVRTKEAR